LFESAQEPTKVVPERRVNTPCVGTKGGVVIGRKGKNLEGRTVAQGQKKGQLGNCTTLFTPWGRGVNPMEKAGHQRCGKVAPIRP